MMIVLINDDDHDDDDDDMMMMMMLITSTSLMVIMMTLMPVVWLLHLRVMSDMVRPCQYQLEGPFSAVIEALMGSLVTALR